VRGITWFKRDFVGVENDFGNRLQDFLRYVDDAVAQLAKKNGLKASEVPLLRPCRVFVGLADASVFVGYSAVGAGSGGNYQYRRALPPPDADPSRATSGFTEMLEQELGYEQARGFGMDLGVLDADENVKMAAVAALAEEIISTATHELDEKNRVVRFNPIFQGRGFSQNPLLAFCLTPFREPFNRIYESHVKPAVESVSGLSCKRADDISDNKAIIEDIWRNICEARVIVAELTGHNPNVFYELGVAHTVGKEVVLLLQGGQTAPFDLTHLRHIRYEDTAPGLKELERQLGVTLNSILAR
jgi:hypothetical protein